MSHEIRFENVHMQMILEMGTYDVNVIYIGWK